MTSANISAKERATQNREVGGASSPTQRALWMPANAGRTTLVGFRSPPYQVRGQAMSLSKGVSGTERAIRAGPAYSSPWDVRKCSASMAAMQPVPAAVTACR